MICHRHGQKTLLPPSPQTVVTTIGDASRTRYQVKVLRPRSRRDRLRPQTPKCRAISAGLQHLERTLVRGARARRPLRMSHGHDRIMMIDLGSAASPPHPAKPRLSSLQSTNPPTSLEPANRGHPALRAILQSAQGLVAVPKSQVESVDLPRQVREILRHVRQRSHLHSMFMPTMTTQSLPYPLKRLLQLQ